MTLTSSGSIASSSAAAIGRREPDEVVWLLGMLFLDGCFLGCGCIAAALSDWLGGRSRLPSRLPSRSARSARSGDTSTPGEGDFRGLGKEDIFCPRATGGMVRPDGGCDELAAGTNLILRL